MIYYFLLFFIISHLYWTNHFTKINKIVHTFRTLKANWDEHKEKWREGMQCHFNNAIHIARGNLCSKGSSVWTDKADKRANINSSVYGGRTEALRNRGTYPNWQRKSVGVDTESIFFMLCFNTFPSPKADVY